MGLFWSMHELGTKTPRDEQALSPPVVSTVTLRAGGTTARLTRRWRLSDVRLHRTTLAREGFVGCYWSSPRKRHPMSAILFFGGSGGGLPCDGGLFASHGYPELDLAYFNYKGLPSQLKRIPLEYFQRALEWLAKQPGVDPKRLVTWGVSRGEEAALLLGTTYPSLVHAVVGYVGSDQVHGDPLAPGQPSWTLNGKAFPIGTLIPVDKVSGPLFLVGAGDDGLGPSAGDVQSMVRMLREYNRHGFVALTYPNAGHAIGFGIPNLPVASVYLTFGTPLMAGGTPAADAHAREDSWPKLLAFLAKLRASS
jgi:dienelactone hydrolase